MTSVFFSPELNEFVIIDTIRNTIEHPETIDLEDLQLKAKTQGTSVALLHDWIYFGDL